MISVVMVALSAAPPFDPTAEFTKGKLSEVVMLNGVTFDDAACAKVSGVGRVTGADRLLLKRCVLQALGATRWRSGGSGPTKTSRLFEVNGCSWEFRFEHDDRGPHGNTTPRDERLVAITRWNIAKANAHLFGQLPGLEVLGTPEERTDAGVTSGVTMRLCVGSDGTVLSCGLSGFGTTKLEAVSAVRDCPRSLKPVTTEAGPLSVCVDAVVRLRDL